MPVNAFLPTAADPGVTFRTLNLTVFDNGLHQEIMDKVPSRNSILSTKQILNLANIIH